MATAAALVAAGNILSRLLGFVREPVIAALFGATGTADAFEVATRLPTMIFDVAIGGAVSAVLVPVFTTVNDDDRSASDLFHSIA
ncbi:MAG TPA: lipid II flippase MurJ, partial [Chloroflexota bacterium]|nr:lipid II flippase MurJ [Chloroflexota bacterium]